VYLLVVYDPHRTKPMFARLALLFIALPIVELALLVWLGSVLGFWPTMGLVVLTGVAGAAMARASGLKVVQQIRAEIAAGRMPVDHMMDGLLVLVGGVLLLTPGILSDLFGIALLVPSTRSLIRRVVQKKLRKLVDTRRIQVMGTAGWPIDVSPSEPWD
jgi:UPF0716 protein FxsA